jgi:hypothetical protein
MVNVLCCVLGTSGDVLPLINVIHEYLNCEENQAVNDFTQCYIITHHYHIESLLEYSLSCKKINYIPLKISPVSVGQGVSAFEDDFEMASAIASVLNTVSVELILCNLFCLEGWLIAHKFDIPCIIIHPTVPFTNEEMRDEIIREFSSSYFCKDDDIPLIDYKLWLWPTLTDKYDNFLECFEKEISCVSSVGKDAPSFPVSSFQVLITTSSLLLPTSTFPSVWPEYCHLSGFIFNKIPLQLKISNIHSLIMNWTANQKKVICIDFGAMTELLYHMYTTRSLVIFLISILSYSKDFSVLFICHRYCHQFQEVFLEYSKNCFPAICDLNFQSRVIWIPGEINHELFLSSCYLFIHHGGIGTSNLAFSLEVPQSKNNFLLFYLT